MRGERVRNLIMDAYENISLFSSYGLKGPVYLKDKTGQVVTPDVSDDSVIFGPGRLLRGNISRLTIVKHILDYRVCTSIKRVAHDDTKKYFPVTYIFFSRTPWCLNQLLGRYTTNLIKHWGKFKNVWCR